MKRTVRHFILVSLLFLIIFVRAPTVLTLPSLQAEDGRSVFAHFYHHRELAQLLRFKAGYIPLVANLIGYLSVRVPIRMAPYVLTWLPLFMTLATYAVFFHRGYAVYVPSDRLRFFICVLFALAPNGQFHLLAHTDYSIWNTLLLLLLLSILRFPRRCRVPFLLIYCVLIWSHPLTIVTLPVTLFFFVKDKRNRVYYVVIVANLVLHQIFGVELTRVSSERDLVDLAQAPAYSCKYLADVSFLTVFGRKALRSIGSSVQFLPPIWAAFPLSAVIVLCRVKRSFCRLCLALGYYIVAITLMIFLARGPRVLEQIHRAPRYLYIQVLFLLVIMVVALAHLLTLVFDRVRGRLVVSGRPTVVAEGIVIGLLTAHYLFLNLYNYAPYRYKHPENGYIVRQFFQRLAGEEERLGSYEGIYLRADKIDDWSIVIDTRERGPATRIVYHDGFYADGVGTYERGSLPWMDLLVELDGVWYGPERCPEDGVNARPLPDGYRWECGGGFACRANGEAWWVGPLGDGAACLVGPGGEVLVQVPLKVTFQSSNGLFAPFVHTEYNSPLCPALTMSAGCAPALAACG